MVNNVTDFYVNKKKEKKNIKTYSKQQQVTSGLSTLISIFKWMYEVVKETQHAK